MILPDNKNVRLKRIELKYPLIVHRGVFKSSKSSENIRFEMSFKGTFKYKHKQASKGFYFLTQSRGRSFLGPDLSHELFELRTILCVKVTI